MSERPSLCPFCGYAATHVDAVVDAGAVVVPVPVEGDASICLGCGEASIFSGPGARVLRKPTAIELAALGLDPKVIEAKAAWARMVAKLGRPTGGYRRGKPS